jgi:hypothetical protein
MLRALNIVREAATRAATAGMSAIDAYREGRVEQEPALTDRMLGAIEREMNDFHHRGVRWTAKTFTDRGRGAQETRVGADFLGVLEISLDGFNVHKGFLGQAKILQRGHSLGSSERSRLVGQCNAMLDRTPDSFVFLYGYLGISVVPAVSVVGYEGGDFHALYSRSLSRFFEEHFESFIGDRRLFPPTIEAVDALRRDVTARSALFLRAQAAVAVG